LDFLYELCYDAQFNGHQDYVSNLIYEETVPASVIRGALDE